MAEEDFGPPVLPSSQQSSLPSGHDFSPDEVDQGHKKMSTGEQYKAYTALMKTASPKLKDKMDGVGDLVKQSGIVGKVFGDG